MQYKPQTKTENSSPKYHIKTDFKQKRKPPKQFKEEQKLKYVSSVESFKIIHQTTFDLLSKKLKYGTKEDCWVVYIETDIDKKNKLLSQVSSEMNDIERRKYNLSMML